MKCCIINGDFIERAKKFGALAGMLTTTAMLLANSDKGGDGNE